MGVRFARRINRVERGRAAVGFTLIELLVVVVIIGAVIGILVPVLGSSLRAARVAGEEQTVRALSFAHESFKSDFGMTMPVVDESVDFVDEVSDIPALRVLGTNALGDSLADGMWTGAVRKYSTTSIPAFLMGAMDEQIDGRVLDGRAGPGMGAVSIVRIDADEAYSVFDAGGRSYGPYYDLGREPERLVRDAGDPGRRAIFSHAWAQLGRRSMATAASGWWADQGDFRNQGIRYYAWDPTLNGAAFDNATGAIELDQAARSVPPELRAPSAVAASDPSRDRLRTDAAFRGATWAMVSPGPDGLFGDEVEAAALGLSPDDSARAREDNIVEVGQ